MEGCFNDYFKVFHKRKKIILGIFFSALIVSLTVNLSLPKVYRISGIISSPLFNTGSRLVKKMKNRILEGVYDEGIKKKLNISDELDLIFRLAMPDDESFLKLSLEASEKNIELGKNILDEMFKILGDELRSFSANSLTDVNNQIQDYAYYLEKLENQVKFIEKKYQLNLLKKQKNSMWLSWFQSLNPKSSFQQSLLSLNNKKAENIISAGKENKSIFPEETMKNIENTYYTLHILRELDAIINESKQLDIENEEINLENTKNFAEKQKTELKIKKLKERKEDLFKIKRIQPIQVSKTPVKPKIFRNVLSISLLILMLSVLFCFVIEE